MSNSRLILLIRGVPLPYSSKTRSASESVAKGHPAAATDSCSADFRCPGPQGCADGRKTGRNHTSSPDSVRPIRDPLVFFTDYRGVPLSDSLTTRSVPESAPTGHPVTARDSCSTGFWPKFPQRPSRLLFHVLMTNLIRTIFRLLL